MKLPVIAVLLGSLSGLAPAASANLIQMTFAGSVTASNMTAFPLAQLVTVAFTYESAGSPQFTANQQAFYVDHLVSWSIASGAYSTSNTGAFGQIDKYDGLGGADGIQFQVAASQLTYQFTNPRPHTVNFATVQSNSVTQSFDNLFVNLPSTSNSVWSDFALPVTYNFGQFDGGKNMIFAFSGGSFQTGITSLVVQDVTTAPEPGTLALLGSSMLALALSRRRRRN